MSGNPPSKLQDSLSRHLAHMNGGRKRRTGKLGLDILYHSKMRGLAWTHAQKLKEVGEQLDDVIGQIQRACSVQSCPVHQDCSQNSMRKEYDFTHGVRGKYARSMTYATRIVPLERETWKAKAELARITIPLLTWRFRDFGCLEADLDEERELSLHIWHPSLNPPKEWTGIVHDHSYVLRSSVLAGEITNHEVLIKQEDDTDETRPLWRRMVATRSMQGLIPGGPLLKERLCVDPLAPQQVRCGHLYVMPMGSFHETSITETTVTLMHRVQLVKGRDLSLLVPEGAPLIRTPKPSRPPEHWILEQALEALRAKPWNR